MATIGSDHQIVRRELRDDDSWLFTVCYTAHFTEDDLGRRFDDSVAIREIHGQNKIAEAQHAVTFTATSPKVFRKKRIVVRGAAIEAVCAEIHLHPAHDLRRWSWTNQSDGTRPRGPGTVSSAGRESGAASSGPS